MLSHCGRFLVVLALIAVTGLHWAALQTAAWAAMLAGNLQTCSFTRAVSQTFDGKHPCPLCKAIAAQRKSEQKNGLALELQKFEFPPVNDNTVLISPSQFVLLPQANVAAGSRPQEPLLPPPRSLFT